MTAKQQATTKAVSRLRSVARKGRVKLVRVRYGTDDVLGVASYPAIAEVAVSAAASVYEPILQELVDLFEHKVEYADTYGAFRDAKEALGGC